jgi:hypothetical protein
MDSSQQIRDAMARVSHLRSSANAQPELQLAVAKIKQFQAQRFVDTYPDLLNSKQYSACAQFFLQELYGARDFSERDTQFARIAAAIELTFPHKVVNIAVTLAQLHCVTEELDQAMALCWRQSQECCEDLRYRQAWRAVGQHEKREWQLATVLILGETLGHLTRKRGIRLMLKMMRRPADLAGLGALQHFLESGFDHFADLAKDSRAVESFLDTIRERESVWIADLFAGN